MKITSWRNCLRKHFGQFLRPARPRTLAKSACVALGLATAWGGESRADITFQVSITPAHDLLDAFVYYGNNATGPTLIPLGELQAGVNYEFKHTLTPSMLAIDSNTFAEVFGAGGLTPLGFAIGGLGPERDEHGVFASFPGDSVVSWEQFVGTPPLFNWSTSEELISEQYFDSLSYYPHHWQNNHLTALYSNYTTSYNNRSFPDDLRSQQYLTPYGEQATLTSFRDTRFAGTAIVSIVSEPGTTGLLVLALVGGFGFIATQGRVS